MNQDEKKDNSIEEYGQMTLENENGRRMIHLLSIIGEVEGHENAPGTSKTTKYDHVLPMLAQIEDDAQIEGMLPESISRISGYVRTGTCNWR